MERRSRIGSSKRCERRFAAIISDTRRKEGPREGYRLPEALRAIYASRLNRRGVELQRCGSYAMVPPSIVQLAMGDGVVSINPALLIRERLIFRLATIEGMRPGEILGLQLQDVGDNSVMRRNNASLGHEDQGHVNPKGGSRSAGPRTGNVS